MVLGAVLAVLALAVPFGVIATAPAGAVAVRARHVTAKGSEANPVPVAAVFTYHPDQDSTQGEIHGAINAVVRVPGGTAVFYSLGGSVDSYASAMPSLVLDMPYNAFDAWSLGIIDPHGMKYYMPLTTADHHCLCSKTVDIGAVPGPSTPYVGYAVLPPLPARMTTVTVLFGFGTVLQDIPVSDKLPVGTVTTTTPVRLGSGWPELPSKAAMDATDKSQSILSLAVNTADPKATTKSTTTKTSIAVNSNVLFDFDRSTLTPRADDVLSDVAAQITKNGAGTVTIVGYTDDVGTAGYNQTLSEARAQAVQAALTKLVTVPGVTFRSSGMGEQDPVADNSTDAGRALNRRVTITFTKGGR